MKVCDIDGCDRQHKAHGVCRMHYSRMMRGTLDKPRYSKPRNAVGTGTEWPYAVRKIDGIWHRRPSDAERGTPWEIVPGFL